MGPPGPCRDVNLNYLQLSPVKCVPLRPQGRHRGEGNRAEAVHRPVSYFRLKRKRMKGARLFLLFFPFSGIHRWKLPPLLAIKCSFNYQLGAESRKLFSSTIVTRK